ncbi:HdeD family acid-resistance protein [Anabaena sp. UHCC 0399]|uniref:HdeD family acid-resistance protein n=1 Tax=Anabaena sp. UHCC 0399 TaxID=3110238 RepID=UPI002B1EBB24|nr:HdeD family acid-resistance protein [Anabaena sp. UHCC 0399]MEA5569025.1 HdeD family acid-resistance protein [Anabaena sp. UHCC 0399]
MRNNFDPMRMGNRLARNWWTLALRGTLAILFGLVALFWPGITITALVLLFAAFLVVGGVLLAIAAFKDRLDDTNAWLMLVEGAVGIIVGILAFIWPGITFLLLLYLIAAWAIITGIFEMIAAFQLRRAIENEWLLVIAGIASFFFGVLLAIWPLAGAVAIVWIIGIYALVFGVLLLALSFRLRNWSNQSRL